MNLRTILSALTMTCLATIFALAAGIVNNSGTSSEDRRSCRVQNWDSAGTHRVAADSFFVKCFGPTGDVVFSAAYDTSASQIQPFYAGGDTVYSYSDLIANIDGTGDPGVYVLDVRAKQSATNLHYVNTFEFQIIGIDLSRGVIDTLLAKDSSIVLAIKDNAISDAAIAPNAIDINEFTGSFAASQFESDAITSEIIAGSAARELADSVLNDSLSYQGAGSSPSAMADAVWDEARAGHTTAGTFGFMLDVPVSSVSGGGVAGAYRCSVLVRDAASGAALSGVDVRVQNTSGAQVASGRTGDQGFAFVYLDNGTWSTSAVEPGWAISPGLLVVAGTGAADTMLATGFDPGAPGAPDLCRVYSYVYGLSGDSLAGVQVAAQLMHGPVRYGAILISPFARSTVTDASGYFALDLIPSSLLTPAGSRYEITATRAAGVVVRRTVTVPDQASWMLEW
jgi:hypothetical protein